MSNASREAPDCTATEGGASSSREAEERLRSEKERASCAHCSMLVDVDHGCEEGGLRRVQDASIVGMSRPSGFSAERGSGRGAKS